MVLRRYNFWFLLLAALVVGSCEKKPVYGHLNVKAPAGGVYDIYRIASESPLQFVSELSGKFNEDIPLIPGRYLVLADCSSEVIIIYPNQIETLVVHRLRFEPPLPPSGHDSFSLQCSRSEKTKSRQHLTNKYELNLIHGKRDILVGMVPMHVDFTAMPDPTNTKDLTFELSALQVKRNDGNNLDTSFFVSPVDEMIAATKYQQFGNWEFLLAGNYMVEVNGTTMRVDLAKGEKRIIQPAILKVTTSDEVDLDHPAKIKGSPWMVEINSGHWLTFNESYPVLPGPATIGISGSTKTVDIEFIEGQEVEFKARSITVDSGCPDDKDSCLGTRNVSLFSPGEPYPFIESISDIPILFIDEGEPVLVGIEGSRDTTYEISANLRDKKISLGYVNLIPEPHHRASQVTDLVRVSTLAPPHFGRSLDVHLEHSTVMPLVAGTYQLEHFISSTSTEGERRSILKPFIVEAGTTTDLKYPVYLSEKRWLIYKKSHTALPNMDLEESEAAPSAKKTTPSVNAKKI